MENYIFINILSQTANFMKKLYILLLFVVSFGYGQNEPFVTTWEVPASSSYITIPIYGTDNNFTVDFGDGIILTNQSESVSHYYSDPGVYTVSISGDFNRLYFNNIYGSDKIRSIVQWGNTTWSSMESAFEGCYNLAITATDSPDLSEVTDMSHMFYECSINQSLNDWDVSNVTDMSFMFSNSYYNQPLNNWDVTNVTTMQSMFKGSPYNQPLDSWNVSNVTTMQSMFEESPYNQPLNSWNVSSVTDMSYMFRMSLFNKPIANWNVSNVVNMSNMFYSTSFVQPLNNWNVANVENMSYMFFYAQFNYPLSNWNVANVTNMNYMFASTNFNQPLNNWNVSNVINMESMFYQTSSFNQPLNAWDVSNVINMNSMFERAINFNQPINDWNMSNVSTVKGMFRNATSFNQPLDSWDTSNIVNTQDMFRDAITFNHPLNSWNTSNLVTSQSMFQDADMFNQPLNNWNVLNIINMQSMFFKADLFNQDISDWNFNANVVFSVYSNFESQFIGQSGMDTSNYDALLSKFVSLQLQGKLMRAHEIKYCDAGVHEYLDSQLGWTFADSGLSQDCQTINTVVGTMLIDENQNGCDVNDIPAINLMLQATNGTYNYGTFVNADGGYDLNVQEATYTVTPQNIPDYFTVTPPSAEVTFTGFGNSEAQNFCLVANQTINDLNVTVLPIGSAQPGFESTYKVLVENIGTQVVTNATVTLNFDNTLQSFVNAAPAPATTTANQLTFSLGNVGIFETKEVNLIMTTFVPPVVVGGEVAVFTATVSPDAGDNTPDDNTFTLNQTIVNSFDPNDKRVVQGSEIYMEQADEYLDYIIRFQNTGTASAITVRIDDVLHENLDWSTIKPTASSHNYNVEITDGNKVSFIFNNINLPHEAANPEGSNGFIAYKIKPKQNIQVGDVMTGDAGIYFDFNLPIITNTVTTTVVPPLSVKEHTGIAVAIYPNPANDVLHIQSKNSAQVTQVIIYNLQGRQLMTVNHNTGSIDVSSLSAGIYMLNVKTDKGSASYKLVKE